MRIGLREWMTDVWFRANTSAVLSNGEKLGIWNFSETYGTPGISSYFYLCNREGKGSRMEETWNQILECIDIPRSHKNLNQVRVAILDVATIYDEKKILQKAGPWLLSRFIHWLTQSGNYALVITVTSAMASTSSAVVPLLLAPARGII